MNTNYAIKEAAPFGDKTSVAGLTECPACNEPWGRVFTFDYDAETGQPRPVHPECRGGSQ